MIDDGRCDHRRWCDTGERPCEQPAKWFNPTLVAGAQRFAWCDEHRHTADIPLPVTPKAKP